MKGGIYVSSEKKHRKVYYHVLEGSRFLIADERNKKRLLDIIQDIQQKEDWTIYAFCIMDDCAYFVTEADAISSIIRGAASIAEQFLQTYGENVTCLTGTPPTVRPGVPEELASLPEIAGRCRQIHWIPLELGYVGRLRDYWWSSYITYAGQYDWQLIDSRTLYGYFADEPGIARTRLRRYHQKNPTLDITKEMQKYDAKIEKNFLKKSKVHDKEREKC
jgi:hypothetical protein